MRNFPLSSDAYPADPSGAKPPPSLLSSCSVHDDDMDGGGRQARLFCCLHSHNIVHGHSNSTAPRFAKSLPMPALTHQNYESSSSFTVLRMFELCDGRVGAHTKALISAALACRRCRPRSEPRRATDGNGDRSRVLLAVSSKNQLRWHWGACKDRVTQCSSVARLSHFAVHMEVTTT